jgi:RNA polymerase sigma factor (TIGR02999 family)
MTEDEKKLLDTFFSEEAYAELKRAAAARLRSSRSISPTTVVHEVYKRFSAAQRLTPESDLHLKRMMILAMRHIIIDKARERHTRKRGDDPVVLTLGHALNTVAPTALERLQVDEALDKLAEQHPRAGEAFKYQLYGECTHVEIAELLGISPDAAGRDIKLARAFLINFLGLAR